jgi:sugar lactone lactonase YvrE
MNAATPATPSTPGAQTPAQNAAGTGATPMDPMGAKDPMQPTMTADPGTVKLPVDMGTPTLYWLDIVAGTVTKAGSDGSGAMNVPSGGLLSAPDGVTIDPEGKHFFVLNMGTVIGGGNRGSLVRYNLDGSGGEVIMKPGAKAGDVTFNTGKQVTIDRVNKKLYMGDREGSKVWRCDYDGGNLEVLVSEHGVQQIVGVGADPTKRQFYFSDRNGKKLFRAGMDMPAGETHADRKDVELIYVEKVGNSMPLDIELDLEHRMIYWTDRTQGKIQGMHMDIPAGETPENRTDVTTIRDGLVEAIGLAYDHQEGRLFVTHGGTVSSIKTDGSDYKRIGSSGSTGISFARIAP